MERGWLWDAAVFSTGNTIGYIVSQPSCCLSYFPLSDVRCLKGKDNLGVGGVMQVERPAAHRPCRRPAWASSQPSSVLTHTHPQQARVVCKAVGGLHQAALPALKATHMPTDFTKQTGSFIFHVERWDGLLKEWVGGFHPRLWLQCKDRGVVPRAVEEFVLVVSSGWRWDGGRKKGSEWMKPLPWGPKLVSSQASAIHTENWEEGEERISAFDPPRQSGKADRFASIPPSTCDVPGTAGGAWGVRRKDTSRPWKAHFSHKQWGWSHAVNCKS